MMMALMLTMMHAFLLQVFTPGNGCQAQNIYSCLAPMYTAWFSIAGISAVAIFAVLLFVYALFSMVGRSDITTWTRVKMYDVLLSLMLIIIFGYAANLIYRMPLGYLNTGAGIVPAGCVGSLYNIYSLSICDMKTFNDFSGRFDTEQYVLMLTIGTLQPEIAVGWNFNAGIFRGGVSTDLSLLEQNIAFKYLGGGIDLVYGFVLANEVQLIILSAAPVLFAILMSLGLVARIFGISRTFGGAMIAFALGLGLVYPMVTILNYGFINTGIGNVFPTAFVEGVTSLGIGALAGFGKAGAIYGALTILPTYLNGGNLANFLPLPIMTYMGLMWIGLTVVPLINLIIVDVFIIDFSQAIGERMDLLSMLIRVL